MKQKNKTILDTSTDARTLARKLIDEANFAAIAVLEPGTGIPHVSRIAVATDNNGHLIFLGSELSNHTKAIIKDPRVSIMVGEPGKGDPLAHPRITLIGEIEKIERSSKERDLLRAPYLERHPKAKLYIDFGDFHFFRLHIKRANLNGGFGKAYELTREDIL
ncbi:MAG: pyridoxamine 5'-phosphate oxidase family protein [Rhizobiaceae bacterium]|nr:pyridoxamine 5'-phosphate oxidase family protein [Rhizobiaceae bacterium]